MTETAVVESDPLASLDPKTKAWIAQRHKEHEEKGYCADWPLYARIRGALSKRFGR